MKKTQRSKISCQGPFKPSSWQVSPDRLFAELLLEAEAALLWGFAIAVDKNTKQIHEQ
jgi:hypothetical protein